MQQSLKRLDLNLFKILAALVRTGSVQESARQLRLSQPTVSRALARLREEFGPQLFQRRSHGLEPSPLAQQLAVAAEQMYTPLESVLAQHYQFDPAEFQQDITLVVERQMLATIGPQLILHLVQAMPKANFNLIGWSNSAQEKLLSGEYHYGLQSNLARLPKSLHTPLLYQDQMALIARRDHPGLGDPDKGETNTLQPLADYPVVRLYLPSVNTLESSHLEQVLRRYKLDARIQLRTDDLPTLITMLKHHDAIMVSGSQLVASLDAALQLYPLARDVAPEVDAALYGVYPTGNKEQPLYSFLDQLIGDMLAQMLSDAR